MVAQAEASGAEISVGAPALVLLTAQAAGSLRVACWKQCGLSAKQLQVTRVLVDAVEVVCVAGYGCAPVTVRVSFTHGQTIRDAGAMPVVPELLPPAAPDAAVCRMLLLQPLALLAMGGMALLGGSIAFENAATDAWLSLLGGRGSIWPRVVFAAAVLAHAAEAGVALRIALGLPNVGLGGALRWCGLTFLVGFPVLRHCLALRGKRE
mmetsp:Transcript_34827/g.111858  ORF Transcript_34827/g.111858 Transcript_34827/m.111858 type:complete len:208 (-) Transcript_34827:99-722(-)